MSVPLLVIDVVRCPHLQKVGDNYECGVIHASSARDACDSTSLERWCLHPEKHTECLFFRGHLKEKKKLVF